MSVIYTCPLLLFLPFLIRLISASIRVDSSSYTHHIREYQSSNESIRIEIAVYPFRSELGKELPRQLCDLHSVICCSFNQQHPHRVLWNQSNRTTNQSNFLKRICCRKTSDSTNKFNWLYQFCVIFYRLNPTPFSLTADGYSWRHSVLLHFSLYNSERTKKKKILSSFSSCLDCGAYQRSNKMTDNGGYLWQVFHFF